MKSIYLSLLSLNLFFFAGCSSQSMSNPSVIIASSGTVANYGNFCFISNKTGMSNIPQQKKEPIETRVTNALAKELEAKGFRLSEPDNANLFVSFKVVFNEEARIELIKGSDLLSELLSEKKLHNGSLVVELLNRNRSPVWCGAYNADIVINVSEKEKDARVTHAAKEIFRYFP